MSSTGYLALLLWVFSNLVSKTASSNQVTSMQLLTFKSGVLRRCPITVNMLVLAFRILNDEDGVLKQKQKL